MLWIKAFHIIFMVTWFAGLFYLPRLFVYHAEIKDLNADKVSHDRFCIMEKKLSIIMSIGAALTIAFGLWLLSGYSLAGQGWLHAKLLLVLGLMGYHGWCQVQVKKFREQRASGSSKYYRLMNEVPAVALMAIVLLAVVKPF